MLRKELDGLHNTVASLKHAVIQGIHITQKLQAKIAVDEALLKERQAAQVAFEKEVVVRGRNGSCRWATSSHERCRVSTETGEDCEGGGAHDERGAIDNVPGMEAIRCHETRGEGFDAQHDQPHEEQPAAHWMERVDAVRGCAADDGAEAPHGQERGLTAWRRQHHARKGSRPSTLVVPCPQHADDV